MLISIMPKSIITTLRLYLTAGPKTKTATMGAQHGEAAHHLAPIFHFVQTTKVLQIPPCVVIF